MKFNQKGEVKVWIKSKQKDEVKVCDKKTTTKVAMVLGIAAVCGVHWCCEIKILANVVDYRCDVQKIRIYFLGVPPRPYILLEGSALLCNYLGFPRGRNRKPKRRCSLDVDLRWLMGGVRQSECGSRGSRFVGREWREYLRGVLLGYLFGYVSPGHFPGMSSGWILLDARLAARNLSRGVGTQDSKVRLVQGGTTICDEIQSLIRNILSCSTGSRGRPLGSIGGTMTCTPRGPVSTLGMYFSKPIYNRYPQ